MPVQRSSAPRGGVAGSDKGRGGRTGGNHGGKPISSLVTKTGSGRTPPSCEGPWHRVHSSRQLPPAERRQGGNPPQPTNCRQRPGDGGTWVAKPARSGANLRRAAGRVRRARTAARVVTSERKGVARGLGGSGGGPRVAEGASAKQRCKQGRWSASWSGHRGGPDGGHVPCTSVWRQRLRARLLSPALHAPRWGGALVGDVEEGPRVFL